MRRMVEAAASQIVILLSVEVLQVAIVTVVVVLRITAVCMAA